MDACEEKETSATNGHAPAAKRAYEAPRVIEFGDVRELTQGAGKTTVDANGTRRQQPF